MMAAMREWMIASSKAKRAQGRVVGDPTQCENRRAVGKRGKLGGKIRIAVSDFLRQRLVARWQAFDCVGDPGTDQLQTVVDARRCCTRRESEFEEGGVQENAGIVDGERAAAGVRPVHAVREADANKPRAAV